MNDHVRTIAQDRIPTPQPGTGVTALVSKLGETHHPGSSKRYSVILLENAGAELVVETLQVVATSEQEAFTLATHSRRPLCDHEDSASWDEYRQAHCCDGCGTALGHLSQLA